VICVVVTAVDGCSSCTVSSVTLGCCLRGDTLAYVVKQWIRALIYAAARFWFIQRATQRKYCCRRRLQDHRTSRLSRLGNAIACRPAGLARPNCFLALLRVWSRIQPRWRHICDNDAALYQRHVGIWRQRGAQCVVEIGQWLARSESTMFIFYASETPCRYSVNEWSIHLSGSSHLEAWIVRLGRLAPFTPSLGVYVRVT